MPSRNITKQQSPESYYHVYARGNNKQILFIEDYDFKYFINLIGRYLSNEKIISKHGEVYPNFDKKIELLAYCLMKNHFHLLIYQVDVPYLEKFMRSLMTSYSRYFNLKYKRTGPVFESRYKAVLIDNDSYIQHITRYIHLNPKRWLQYSYSSLKFYKNSNPPYWLKSDKIIEMFDSIQDYMNFLKDDSDIDKSSSEISSQLANK